MARELVIEQVLLDNEETLEEAAIRILTNYKIEYRYNSLKLQFKYHNSWYNVKMDNTHTFFDGSLVCNIIFYL